MKIMGNFSCEVHLMLLYWLMIAVDYKVFKICIWKLCICTYVANNFGKKSSYYILNFDD